MNMGMIKAALLSRSAIPPQYQRVEYIESTGVQYINTGVQIGNTDEYEISFMQNELADSAYQSAYGGRTSSGVNDFQVYVSNTDVTRKTIRIGGSAVDYRTEVVSNSKIDIKYTISLFVDGVDTGKVSPSFLTPVPVYLFALNNNGSLSQLSKSRIFKFVVKNKCNLIPCRRKSDNKPGMYDTVSRSFLVNQGTGADFILGPDVI